MQKNARNKYCETYIPALLSNEETVRDGYKYVITGAKGALRLTYYYVIQFQSEKQYFCFTYLG